MNYFIKRPIVYVGNISINKLSIFIPLTTSNIHTDIIFQRDVKIHYIFPIFRIIIIIYNHDILIARNCINHGISNFHRVFVCAKKEQ